MSGTRFGHDSHGTLLVVPTSNTPDKRQIWSKAEREKERTGRLLQFLGYVAENPGVDFTHVHEGLHWSQTKGEDIQDILQRNGFIRKDRKSHSGKSTPPHPRYLYLTKKGEAALREDPKAKKALLESR